MTTFLLIAVIILAIAIIGILLYLWWLPVKIKKMIRQNDEDNDAIVIEENTVEKEDVEDEQ